MRPAPVVLGRGVVHLDAVRRGEHAPAGSRDAPQLAHRLRRVVAVLEHLRAEDDIEARVLDRQRLDRPAQLGNGVLDDVDADVLARVLREEGVVRLRAAAHVEQARYASRFSAPDLRATRRAVRARPRSTSSWAGVAAPRQASRDRSIERTLSAQLLERSERRASWRPTR